MRNPDSYGDFVDIANKVGETSPGSQNSTAEAFDSESLQNASGPLSGTSSTKTSDSVIADTTAGLDSVNEPLLSDKTKWIFDTSFFQLPSSSEASSGDAFIYAIILRNAGKEVADIFKKEFHLNI